MQIALYMRCHVIVLILWVECMGLGQISLSLLMRGDAFPAGTSRP